MQWLTEALLYRTCTIYIGWHFVTERLLIVTVWYDGARASTAAASASGAVDGGAVAHPSLNFVLSEKPVGKFSRRSVISDAAKPPFQRNLEAKLKFRALIISFVRNLQLPVVILSEFSVFVRNSNFFPCLLFLPLDAADAIRGGPKVNICGTAKAATIDFPFL